MVVFEARTYLAIATAVWIVWRFAAWRVRPRDPIREVVLTALLVWSLAVVDLTFFPLRIVLVAVWGTNRDGASTIVVNGNGASERSSLPTGSHFLVAFQLPLDADAWAAPTFEDFSISFFDDRGSDVSHLFEVEGR